MYDDIISKSNEGKKIIMDETKFITSVIMIAVKYSSMQRPGAVINCLVNRLTAVDAYMRHAHASV